VIISQVQKDIIVGTMLGDATMEANPNSGTARIRYQQTYPAHSSYLLHIYYFLQNLVKTYPSIHVRQPDKRTNKVYSTIGFSTLSYSQLFYFFQLFYVTDSTGKRRKIVPGILGVLLTARALAFWIMDDGGMDSYKATILHTNNFTLAEVEFIQQVLKDNFELRTRIVQKQSKQWVIVIPVRQKIPLSQIVGPYMEDSMRRKVKGL